MTTETIADQSKAKTAEEVRGEFLDYIRTMVQYWSDQGGSDKDKLEGLAFSILNIFDGTTAALPAMDIALSPHPDDKQYAIDNGDDWYELGLVINDCYLHELFIKKEAANDESQTK